LLPCRRDIRLVGVGERRLLWRVFLPGTTDPPGVAALRAASLRAVAGEAHGGAPSRPVAAAGAHAQDVISGPVVAAADPARSPTTARGGLRGPVSPWGSGPSPLGRRQILAWHPAIRGRAGGHRHADRPLDRDETPRISSSSPTQRCHHSDLETRMRAFFRSPSCPCWGWLLRVTRRLAAASRVDRTATPRIENRRARAEPAAPRPRRHLALMRPALVSSNPSKLLTLLCFSVGSSRARAIPRCPAAARSSALGGHDGVLQYPHCTRRPRRWPPPPFLSSVAVHVLPYTSRSWTFGRIRSCLGRRVPLGSSLLALARRSALVRRQGRGPARSSIAVDNELSAGTPECGLQASRFGSISHRKGRLLASRIG